MKTLGVDTVALNFWWYQSSVTANTMAAAANSSTIASVQSAIDTIHGLGHEGPPQADARRQRRQRGVPISIRHTRHLVRLRRHQSVHERNAALAGSYGNFIDTFADIAQSKGVEMLSIGCEMNNMENATNDQHWKNLIDNVRTHYSGPLTYSANWATAGTSPVDGITWTAVTTTSVGGISLRPGRRNRHRCLFSDWDSTSPLAQLQSSWTTTANTIDNWRTHRRRDRQAGLFTETGYSSYDGTARDPYARAGSQARSTSRNNPMRIRRQLTVMSNRELVGRSDLVELGNIAKFRYRQQLFAAKQAGARVLASNYGGTVPALSVSSWNTNRAALSAPPAIGIAACPIKTSSPHSIVALALHLPFRLATTAHSTSSASAPMS